MQEEGILATLEFWQLIVLLIPVIIGVGVTVWRIFKYFWNKEICFRILKEQVKSLSEAETGSRNTHGDLYEKYNELSNRVSGMERELKLLLNHFNIKPD